MLQRWSFLSNHLGIDRHLHWLGSVLRLVTARCAIAVAVDMPPLGGPRAVAVHGGILRAIALCVLPRAPIVTVAGGRVLDVGTLLWSTLWHLRLAGAD